MQIEEALDMLAKKYPHEPIVAILRRNDNSAGGVAIGRASYGHGTTFSEMVENAIKYRNALPSPIEQLDRAIAELKAKREELAALETGDEVQ